MTAARDLANFAKLNVGKSKQIYAKYWTGNERHSKKFIEGVKIFGFVKKPFKRKPTESTPCIYNHPDGSQAKINYRSWKGESIFVVEKQKVR